MLSVESLPEHLFVRNWLNERDPSTQRWITSGRRSGPFWQWTKSTGLMNFQFDQGWLPRTEEDQRRKSFLVYAFQSTAFLSRVLFSQFLLSIIGSQWGWLPYDIAPAETLPFICEIPIRETYGISTDYRGIGKLERILDNEQ